ncbi:histidine phosphatase family protein [Pseudalkalibacillus sp. SCS-8]|uniref:histidine phosphatase family protein n=1 Tax=Pseudalkalibacillus nanhaiensis TaxID=3115291 RepID=UPI0032DA3480
MATNIYIVRHCKAEGQPPEAPLTQEGFEQADELARFFTDKKIQRIISSPFTRAQQSIKPTAQQLGVQVELDDRLAERILSSQPLDDWMDKLAASYEDMHLKFEGGESSQEALRRALAVIDEVKGGDEDAIIVTHGNLMSLILQHYDDVSGFEKWKELSNPDVYHLSFDEGSNLQRIWR